MDDKSRRRQTEERWADLFLLPSLLTSRQTGSSAGQRAPVNACHVTLAHKKERDDGNALHTRGRSERTVRTPR
jgi:hypothetical protein